MSVDVQDIGNQLMRVLEMMSMVCGAEPKRWASASHYQGKYLSRPWWKEFDCESQQYYHLIMSF